ncbi:MAG: thiamine pyrophosphate-binding protein [Betaproteobacteria bacterium]
MKNRGADYIARRMAGQGLTHVFGVTGGGAMHLNDAFGAEPGLKKVYFHHEQAAAMAAEGYARIAGRPAIVNVTTGPGGINALNGVFGAYADSIPMVVVSGQVKRETLLALNPIPGLRQLGDQEVDIMAMAAPVTKWRRLVRSPEEIPDAVDSALVEAVTGRPGPAWIDVPVDVQGAPMPEGIRADLPLAYPSPLVPDAQRCISILAELSRAKRPVILAGSGVRIAGAERTFLEVAEHLGIPVVTAWTHDLIHDDHPLYAGRPGTIGTRAGNFVVQNADCVLVLGSRLNIRQVSYNWASFARNARKIWVDIDPAEFDKPYVRADLVVAAHLAPFLDQLRAAASAANWAPRHEGWLRWCQSIRRKYSPVATDYPVSPDAINAYHFVDELFRQLSENDIVVCGDATATIVPFQIGRLKPGMRLFSNSGSASMGYDLPAAIGAAIARPDARVVCLAGDGSIMMNIQELQTLRALGANVKVLVLDNGGYLSIKQTQWNFFGREFGASPESGITFPDFPRIGEAFGLPSSELTRDGWRKELGEVLARDGPVVCSVPLDRRQEFQPRLKSRMVDGVIRTPELEDMFPFLPSEEIRAVRQSAQAID